MGVGKHRYLFMLLVHLVPSEFRSPHILCAVRALFVIIARSLKMDKWKAKELKCLELGGNKNALAYYEKNGMIAADGKPNHQAPQLAKYKLELAKRAE